MEQKFRLLVEHEKSEDFRAPQRMLKLYEHRLNIGPAMSAQWLNA